MIIGHPGTWQQFQFRPDNRGLNVMEMKSKYLHEQYLFEAQVLNQIHQQNMFMNGSGGGGPLPSSEPEPPAPTYSTALQLTFNTSLSDITDAYGWDITTVSGWNENGIFLNGEDPSNFETIDVDNDNNIITLKGNEENLTIVGRGFRGDPYLTSIIDSNDNCIVEIGNETFSGAEALEEARLNAVTTMGTEAFFTIPTLQTISFTSLSTIPNSSTGDETGGVFNGCLLDNIDFETDFPLLETVGSYAFYRIDNTNEIISNSIITIGRSAFQQNNNLTALRLTNSVNIGVLAFSGCTLLNSMNIPQDSTYDDTCFDNIAETGTATVNDADDKLYVFETYLKTAPYNWTINIAP